MSARAVLVAAEGLMRDRYSQEAVTAFLTLDEDAVAHRAQERTISTLLAVGGEVE